MREEAIVAEGIITKVFHRHQFEVSVKGNSVFGQLSGKMVKHHVWVVLGDKVLVEFSPYDVTKCRIIRRC